MPSRPQHISDLDLRSDFDTPDASWYKCLPKQPFVEPDVSRGREPVLCLVGSQLKDMSWIEVVKESMLKDVLALPSEQPAMIMITGMRSYPDLKFQMTRSMMAVVGERLSPMLELLSALVPDNAHENDSTAGEFTGRIRGQSREQYWEDYWTSSPQPPKDREMCFTIYCCQRVANPKAEKGSESRRSIRVGRTTFYNCFSATGQGFSRVRWIIFGDCSRLTSLFQAYGFPTSVAANSTRRHIPGVGHGDGGRNELPTLVVHRLLAHLAKEGWRQLLSEFEAELIEVQQAALKERENSVDDGGPNPINIVFEIHMQIEKARMQIGANIAVLRDLRQFLNSIELPSTFQKKSNAEMNEALRVLERRLARAEYLEAHAKKLVNQLSISLSASHNSRMEVLGWNGLKLNYLLQSSVKLVGVCVLIFLPGLFISALFSTYFFPDRNSDSFDSRGFSLWLGTTSGLTIVVLAISQLWNLTRSGYFSRQFRLWRHKAGQEEVV